MHADVQFLQLRTQPGAPPTTTPVMLQKDGPKFILQNVTEYNNFKKLAHSSN